MSPTKEDILNESYRKAQLQIGTGSEKKQINFRKFRKLGLLLIIMSLISLIITSQMPWAYVKYDSKFVEGKTIEESVDENPYEGDFNETSFFKFKNGSQNIGISLDDFHNSYAISFYSLIALIIIGIILTIFEIITWKKDEFYDLGIVINSIALIVVALVIVNLIIIFSKFISSHLMITLNSAIIIDHFPSLSIIFLLPLFMIIIMSVLLKIIFTILKINFNELEKKYKSESLKSKYYHKG